MQKLQTVNAETLLYEPLEKPSFVVDSLIPTGLSLFCGSQKIGKSWLMLKLCLCVSQGIPLWDMPTMEGDVLYLCLEDTFCRIQDRLFRLTDEASGRLHFAVASCKLSDGLIVQLEDYLKDYPDSRLIVIDTLQKVRTASKDNAYASDYGDISLIKDFADRHSLAVIVVHHIRKQNDSDVFNKVSGTTGLTGSADATFSTCPSAARSIPVFLPSGCCARLRAWRASTCICAWTRRSTRPSSRPCMRLSSAAPRANRCSTSRVARSSA